MTDREAMKPKIKPRLMWAIVSDNGVILYVDPHKIRSPHETVCRVLVCAPPRRKRR